MTSSTPNALKRLLYNPEETRIALGISARKLWSMTASGEISHVKIGRCVRYDIRDLEAAIDRMKKGGQP